MQRTWSISILVISLVIASALIMMERLASAAPTRRQSVLALSELENRNFEGTFVMPCNYTKEIGRVDIYLYYIKPDTSPPETLQYTDDLELVRIAEPTFFGEVKKDTVLLKANPSVKTRDGMTLSHIQLDYPVNPSRRCDGSMFETLTR